jgi:hypothetical protein
MNTEFRFDVRIRQRMIDKGLLTPEQVEQYEKGLPDLEQQCEVIPLEQPVRVAAERDRA